LNFVKTISTQLGKLNRRVIKHLRLGKSNVQTSLQVAPHGIDSNPVKDLIAIYAETGEKGKTIILGYLNKNVLAEIGETRLFSTDSSGALKTFIWLKNDGTMQIGGDTKHMVRFEELETGFNTLKTDFNNHLTAFNAHMHATAGTGPPVPPTPGTGIPAVASTASISGAKIDEIKTL
jgi:hypothetical protein